MELPLAFSYLPAVVAKVGAVADLELTIKLSLDGEISPW